MSEAKPYALIDAEGKVYNIALWDGETPWEHGAVQLIQSDVAGVGWTYVDGEFKPPPPILNVIQRQLEERADDSQ